jgi:hypothetical protein
MGDKWTQIQALRYNPRGSRITGRPRKRWACDTRTAVQDGRGMFCMPVSGEGRDMVEFIVSELIPYGRKAKILIL